MGKKQLKRELKRLWRYTESLNAWFESALNRCEDLVGALEKTHGVGTCSQYGPGVGSDSVAKLGDAVQPEEPICIFSGDRSRKMWDAINNARTKEDLRGALYFVCCRLQEFESLNEHDHQVIQDAVDELERAYQKLRVTSDWLEAVYGEFHCGINAECTNERCAQAQRCAHCAISLGETVENTGARVAQFENRIDALEQRQRDDDATLAATVPMDSRGPALQPQPRSILGCAGPNEIGLATDEFLESVPRG